MDTIEKKKKWDEEEASERADIGMTEVQVKVYLLEL